MTEQRALSVTEAMTLAKQALESVRLRVVGEVSEFNDKPGYKAAYFTICDGSASMSCLMWRDVYAASGISLRCGMLVELSGQFSAYVAKGRMQFTVRSLAFGRGGPASHAGGRGRPQARDRRTDAARSQAHAAPIPRSHRGRHFAAGQGDP